MTKSHQTDNLLYTSVASLAFLGQIYKFGPLDFFIFEKRPNELWLFWPFLTNLFLCGFSRFKDDLGRFLDTVTGHRMVNFYCKLCTTVDFYNF